MAALHDYLLAARRELVPPDA